MGYGKFSVNNGAERPRFFMACTPCMAGARPGSPPRGCCSIPRWMAISSAPICRRPSGMELYGRWPRTAGRPGPRPPGAGGGGSKERGAWAWGAPFRQFANKGHFLFRSSSQKTLEFLFALIRDIFFSYGSGVFDTVHIKGVGYCGRNPSKLI